ncbi:cytochrome P450 [Eremomyces bilateralis CBS 781.70]|uniref:Cytochrome P450 n=1 Tax=Eremomyces bilateralis CBS 781.70 TaxID=1392243 RepID=A0A6G1GHF5_9PEZI|nr:cytochrome P450 [Eremomyces bilateralis CBS 781.70]KAF1817444.1 cytochrome P450 [Eremomyces bilateralis CBS 781.70]
MAGFTAAASPVTVAAGLAVLGIGYLIGLVIYRLYFHPLARFPGPKIVAATYWYEACIDMFKGIRGQYYREVEKMHQKYGPIVRINPDEIHVSDPGWFELLYAGQPARRDKWPATAMMLGTTLGTFGTVDHYMHRKRRAANSALYTLQNIASSEPLIHKHLARLCEVLRSSNGKVIELRRRFIAFTSDSLADFAFGETFGIQDDEDAAENCHQTFNALTSAAPFIKQFPWCQSLVKQVPLPVAKLLAPHLSKRVRDQAAKFMAHEYAELEEKHEPRLNIFQAMQDSPLPIQEKSIARMADVATEVFFAGSGPMSRALSTGVFFLLNNADALQRLKEELNQAIPNINNIPQGKALESLPWLSAVVRETFRISTIISSRIPLVPQEDLVYQEWVIPAGTPIAMSQAAILLDPNIFPEPREFRPERWLADNEAQSGSEGPLRTDLDKYFVPFSKGGRKCQGQVFATMELRVTLAVVFRRFELELYETIRERDVDNQRDCFLGESMPDSPGIRVRVLKEYAY